MTTKTSFEKSANRPLDGLRVIEFAGLGPAPFCCMLLADMGATIIRIDRPGTTEYKPEDVEARGRKDSITLDLKTIADRQRALCLVDSADVLVEGFRPGVMEKLALGPEAVFKVNPGIIYGRMTGWGQTGPMANKAGHDLNYLSLSGALHAIGSKDKPAVPLNLIADFGGGALYLAMGILAALFQRQKTDQGTIVDCAMNEGVISMMGMIYGDFAAGNWIDQREKNVIDGAAPFYNVYQCADGKWLSVAAIEEKFYCEFIDILNSDETDFDGSDFNEQWNKNQWPELKNKLSKHFKLKSRDQWCQLFEHSDACVTPVLSLAEASLHPHNQARSAFIEIDGIIQPAPSPKFSNFSAQQD